MGHLHYGNDAFRMDDRVLLHLQIAVHEVARHRKAFYVTWILPREQGGGRRSAFITPGVPLLFAYDGGRAARVNRVWVEHMISVALSGPGLVVIPEDQAVANPSGSNPSGSAATGSTPSAASTAADKP